MDAAIFETLMLICFAASWPFNIRKSLRARTVGSKSVEFEYIIEVGYACGIISHFIGDDMTYVIAFYVLDMALVAIDICIYYRNRALDIEKGWLKPKKKKSH